MVKVNYYNGNPQVKRDGVQQVFTEHELTESIRCTEDPVYFVENYMKIINLDKGLVKFKPYHYQRKLFRHFNENRFSVILACRQSGKSISSVGYILWYALFHSEKKIAVLANKGAIAREMLSRITLALENIPFFLQPGCTTLNKGNIIFSNNSEILAASTTSNSIRGLSCNLIFLDEFAFIEKAADFYTSTYPVISSGDDTKVIITSTANGIGNMFYNLYEGAIKGTNMFKHFRIDWWDVPGRDEEWKKMTIQNTSELQFAQEYGNDFQGASDSLINSSKLLELVSLEPIKKHENMRFYKDPVEGHQYVAAVDVSRGRGQDYSTLTIIDVSTRPFEQVATYRSNLVSPLIFPDTIVSMCTAYNDAVLLIESNDAGQVVCNAVYYDHEYENTFVESSIKRGGIGVTMTKKIKRVGCSNMKDLIEMNKLLVCDKDTIAELGTFGVHASSYAATGNNHDDMVMNLVLFSWFVSSDAFGEIVNDENMNLRDLIFAEKEDDDLVPAGFFDTHGPAVSDYQEMADNMQAWNEL